MKKNKLHPYKPDLVQKLVPDDSNRRLIFIAWFMVQLHDEPDFLRFICLTDELKFTNNGITKILLKIIIMILKK